jgi:predicted dehydrogenase
MLMSPSLAWSEELMGDIKRSRADVVDVLLPTSLRWVTRAAAQKTPSLTSAHKYLSFVPMQGADLKAYGSYEEVLSDPRVDVVYMPLPTSLHVEWVAKAAAQKKHVLLEKPPALSMEDMAKVGALR